MATIIIDTEPIVYPNTNNFTASDIEPFKCNICQEDTSNNKVITPCEHIFCGECFFKWMQEKPNCPLCRKEFVNENIMTNINANREELSVISSEINYLKVRASKLKRQAGRMYIKSEMHWERQIRLRKMLESTREEIIFERKILKKLRKKTKKSKLLNKLYNKEEVEISGVLDYIDGYCTRPVEELNTYSDLIGETKEDTEEDTEEDTGGLEETLWNNMLLREDNSIIRSVEFSGGIPVENPEEAETEAETEAEEYASDTYTADYSSEYSSSAEDSYSDYINNFIQQWPTLNEAYPNEAYPNDETVIFTFGEN
jgi:hypothetical protein